MPSLSQACTLQPSAITAATALPRSMRSCPLPSAPWRRLLPLSAASPSASTRVCGAGCLPLPLLPIAPSCTLRRNSGHVPSSLRCPRVPAAWSLLFSLWSCDAACAFLTQQRTSGALVATVCLTPIRDMRACAWQVATAPDVTTLPATLLPTGRGCNQKLRSLTSCFPSVLMRCAWPPAGPPMSICLLGMGRVSDRVWSNLPHTLLVTPEQVARRAAIALQRSPGCGTYCTCTRTILARTPSSWASTGTNGAPAKLPGRRSARAKDSSPSPVLTGLLVWGVEGSYAAGEAGRELGQFLASQQTSKSSDVAQDVLDVEEVGVTD